MAIDEINELIAEYEFPGQALIDINHRLECCQDEHYVEQQLRYLKNLMQRGFAKRRKNSEE